MIIRLDQKNKEQAKEILHIQLYRISAGGRTNWLSRFTALKRNG
nr:hypothetical protein P5627_12000 [Bacillus safensis]